MLRHRGRLKRSVLVDCGLFQGPKTEKELNYRPFPFASARDRRRHPQPRPYRPQRAVCRSSSRQGFSGPIYATRATIDLAGVMLPDSGHIQEIEVEQLNRRNARRGFDPVEPI